MKFQQYLNEAVPKGGAQHVPGALKSFAKRKEKEAKDYRKAHSKGSAFRKSVDIIKEKQPKWTKLEGQDILQVPGSKYAALPSTGKKNAANFVVFDVNTRKEVTYLKKKEVTGWLAKRAADGE